ncbi:MAG: hypothetical protein IPQ28_01175 [Sphingobacteriales bacterium]|nr:hypothetical protein [Sphingobacteriales bacterium]
MPNLCIFDVLYRYLKHIGYKVRFVRNITDVGHLENEVLTRARIELQKSPLRAIRADGSGAKYSNNFL